MERLILNEEDNLYYIPSGIKCSTLRVRFRDFGDEAFVESRTRTVVLLNTVRVFLDGNYV